MWGKLQAVNSTAHTPTGTESYSFIGTDSKFALLTHILTKIVLFYKIVLFLEHSSLHTTGWNHSK